MPKSVKGNAVDPIIAEDTPAPIASLSGPVTGCPLMMMVTASRSSNSPHATRASISITSARATCFAISVSFAPSTSTETAEIL
jgi:hypothetical protein